MKIIHYVTHYLLLGLALLSAFTIRALDSEGNLTVAGFIETDLNDLRDTLFSVTQYNPSGMINTDFGSDGIAALDFRHGVAMNLCVNPNDNTIAVVGTAIDPAIGLPRAILAKFISTGMDAGELDPSFNTNGVNAPGNSGFIWLTDAPSVANDIDLSADEKSYFVCGSFIQNGRYYGNSWRIEVIDGTIAETFSSVVDIKLNANKLGLAAGKSIAGGTPRPVLIFLTQDPSPVFTADISGEFLDIALNANADSYVVGTHANKGLLIKLEPDMPLYTPDSSFGSNGYVIAEFACKQTMFNAVKVDTSTDPERIFVCGTARGLQSRMFVAEYDTSGNLVPTFGDNGVMTIFEGPNVQTIARDLVLPNLTSGLMLPNTLFSSCPSGSSTGMFALGAANGRTPLIANLNCSGGALKNEYGDKAIASLETEALTSMTVLKEVESSGIDLPIPSSSPFAREFNTLLGNPFAVSLTGSGTGTGFVLQPGRYYVDAQAPLADVSAHQLALYNDQISANELLGDAIWNSSGILTKALLKGQLFISQPTKYILRHYFGGTTGIGFSAGQAINLFGEDEVYAQMNIQQL